jgi:hypothetical protein
MGCFFSNFLCAFLKQILPSDDFYCAIIIVSFIHCLYNKNVDIKYQVSDTISSEPRVYRYSRDLLSIYQIFF